jgi:hypothetical protein
MMPKKPRRPGSTGDPESTALLDRTLAVWQPRTSRPLAAEDARQIIENVSGFFAVLLEWAAAERRDASRPETAEKVPGHRGPTGDGLPLRGSL